VERGIFAALDDIGPANSRGTFAAAEAWSWHRALIARRGAEYDPRVRSRIQRGQEQSAADYFDLLRARQAIMARMDRDTAPFDALVMPTTPVEPPRLAELADDREYNRVNMLLLRNTALGNFLDRCAISLPCHAADEPPAGLMLMGETGGDRHLFAVALAVEAALADT
jgi:aspartyl-tRNA(Asn)/glutamyl-tRNA(Gln) amidotransferase subunit A